MNYSRFTVLIVSNDNAHSCTYLIDTAEFHSLKIIMAGISLLISAQKLFWWVLIRNISLIVTMHPLLLITILMSLIPLQLLIAQWYTTDKEDQARSLNQ